MKVKKLTPSLNKLCLCIVSLLLFSSAKAGQVEDLSNIRETAESFALKQVDGKVLNNIEAHAIVLDARLKLAKCDSPLEAFATTRSNSIVRTTIGVRCTSSKPWSLYVPVTISAMSDVVYTARALMRGELLQSADMEIRQVPLDQLPPNYLSDIDQLAGMELSRAVKPNIVLTMNTIQLRKIVQRGQEVIILAKGHGVQVRMSGVALKDGVLGDLIPIRNIKSKRTIEAVIMNESTVIVNM